jgi:hypothetical protein
LTCGSIRALRGLSSHNSPSQRLTLAARYLLLLLGPSRWSETCCRRAIGIISRPQEEALDYPHSPIRSREEARSHGQGIRSHYLRSAQGPHIRLRVQSLSSNEWKGVALTEPAGFSGSSLARELPPPAALSASLGRVQPPCKGEGMSEPGLPPYPASGLLWPVPTA